MDNSGSGSFMRNRRLESFLNTSSSPTYREKPKVSVKEEAAQKPKADVYQDDDDDDGWVLALISCIRIVTCFLTMMVTTFIWALIMLVLLPWPYERIRQGNIYGHVTGRLLMWILGNPRKIEGSEFSNKRAIYICNHASPLDIFLIMWLTPTGTVGIAKKEIMWYPLFGQLYILANHLRIDRSNPTAAIQSLKEAADAVVRNNLSLIIFPEGTRSRNGRLLPFKKAILNTIPFIVQHINVFLNYSNCDLLRNPDLLVICLHKSITRKLALFPFQGFVHLALQSGLPIVPMVFTGTHLAWRKGSLHVRPAPLTVRYLDPIITDDWTADKIDEYVKMVHNLYVKHLPESQRPPES
ncbi:hypothetical protein FEM48_Zijuj01G0229800 [Ziziphus jujuba var. spinosa]|uniref:Phospholipid/glycerol acyltransferase domain-containing protein n=1 Tax=Ziziphus jujuba var. spinosa TaxID=714518 RepID=A0A978W420_ZIZJJ|nr:hypothetical protein FEM48_Zijuj01G0229800 [Ziziphus jujuba var. spinosa]